jgi:hypothetical protein
VQADLAARPPAGVDAFVEAVLEAQGFEPHLVSKEHRSGVADIVRDWLFDDGLGRGSKSGLPLLPDT